MDCQWLQPLAVRAGILFFASAYGDDITNLIYVPLSPSRVTLALRLLSDPSSHDKVHMRVQFMRMPARLLIA